jgi:predicted RNA methylase
MSKQTTGLRRNTTDKYYTAPLTVKTCIQKIKQHLSIDTDDLCIEPSAGNGAFIPGIKSLACQYTFYDVEPEHNEIIKQNYLTLDIPVTRQKIHLIGNPPFGRQSSLAIQFIKKSAEFCNSFSFILPKSFKKDSLQKHFPLSFHLIYECDLPDNSFIVDNQPHDVPCVFQIWLKKEFPRIVTKKLVPHGFTFVKKEEDHDISFRRVGVNAGAISKETQDKSIQSHYFIKFEIPFTDELFDKISAIQFTSSENTCGPKSISKQELMKEFNMVL